MYAMICGFLPFEDNDQNELYRKIKEGIYELPDTLSENAQSLLQGLLNIDPDQRFGVE